MRIDVTCVELLTEEPVAGVRLDCTVKVAPRVTQHVPAPGPQVALSPGPMAVPIDDDPDPPDRVVVVESQAVLLTAPARVSDANGQASFQVDVGPTYRRLTNRNQSDIHFVDVGALLQVRGRLDGLDRQSMFEIVSTSAQDPAGDVEVERVVIVDLAKAIVGHTTDRTCRLWFQLHGAQLRDHVYECVVTPDRAGVPGAQRLVVPFDEPWARTGTRDATGLAPGEGYSFRLVSRLSSDSDGGRTLCQGSFRTAAANEEALTMMFGSCFKPLDDGPYDPVLDMVHWRRLADEPDGDVLLLLGDQVYGDEVLPRDETAAGWYDGYVHRYNAFWAYQPVRRALSRRPTYMIADDHEVKDDWGIDLDIPEQRIKGGVKAIRTYQLAHSPSGRDGTVHYHFRRGPVAFFMMDGRTARGTDDEFPIFGRRQWDDFVAWARSDEVRTADIIVFANGLPLSLLPINDLRETVENEAIATGVLAGAAVGGIFGGPGGALVVAAFGAVGADVAYKVAEHAGLDSVDYREMWTYRWNQPELVRVLNVLFNLANDIDFTNPDAGPGAHPRAVFVMGGDCHFGLIHLIASNHTAPDHRTNPQLFHLTSSAIGRKPQDSGPLKLLFRDVDEDAKDYADIVDLLTQNLASKATRFVLDDKSDEHYRAQCLGALFERNVGRLRVERVDEGRRYKVEATIEGETRNLEQVLEVDLDRRPVEYRAYQANLGLTPSTISFGGVRAGQVVTRTLTIENFTGHDLNVRVAPPPAGPISWTAFEGTIPHRSRQRITTRFQSTGSIVNSTMVIRSDTPASPQRIALSGKGVGGFPTPPPDAPPPSKLTISPSTVTFGSVPVGQTVSRTVTIENQTGRSVQVTVAASSSGPISWPSFRGSIAHGTQRRITARFQSTGSFHNANMTISSDTPASPQKVALSGKGPGGFSTLTPNSS